VFGQDPWALRSYEAPSATPSGQVATVLGVQSGTVVGILEGATNSADWWLVEVGGEWGYVPRSILLATDDGESHSTQREVTAL
jgi:hypothetical protein